MSTPPPNLNQIHRDNRDHRVAQAQANMIVPRPIPSRMSVAVDRVRDVFTTYPKTSVWGALTATAAIANAFKHRAEIVQKIRSLPQTVQAFRNMDYLQKTQTLQAAVGVCTSIVSLYIMKKQYDMIMGDKIDLASSDRDLSRKSKRGLLPPMAGRNDVINKVMTSLLCTDKPNVILVGPPGVGKTAIAEGLAAKLANTPKAQLPEPLRNAKVIEIKPLEFQKGTAFMGAFERKVERFLKDVENSPNLIIFIDEIHALMNVGSISSNLRDVLKPLLARGKCHIIGATTSKEIAILQSDGALMRRFQRIDVQEPKGRELQEMVAAAAQRYADKHGCKFQRDALEAAVKASEKLSGHYPDKALTLLDQAGVTVSRQFPNDKEARVVTPRVIEQAAGRSMQSIPRHMGLSGPLEALR